MVAELEKKRRRRSELHQLTAWVNPRLRLKERLERVREIDQRMTISRMMEDAILMYLPVVERRVLPMQGNSTQGNSSAA